MERLHNYLCIKTLCDFSQLLNHSGSMNYFCGGCMILFFAETLHNFFSLKRCIICFVERLRDFVCGKVACFLCGEVA